MIKISRLGHLTLETPDIERQLDYYQRVMGLHVVERDADAAHLSTEVGELALVLRRGTKARCAQLSFQLRPSIGLADAERLLASEGIGSERRHDATLTASESLIFTDLNGTQIALTLPPEFQPAASRSGINPLKLGHVAFVVEDPEATSAFYARVLGFRVSDWVDRFFVFMRCGPDHHTVNFLRSANPRMHHFAFEMRDAAHLIESCDMLGRDKLEILWGPVRHGPGHNIATYHLNTDHLMIELFTELDRMSDEESGSFDPRPWHHDRPQVPKTWGGRTRRDVWGPSIPTDFLLQGY